MFKFPRYSLSLTHGFCHPTECLQSLPGLSDHISLLTPPNSFSPNLLSSIPEYQPPKSLDPSELEFAFLVHTMLNTYLYWYNEQPAIKIPKNLARPTVLLSKLLDRPPILSLVSIQYHNWVYLSKPGLFHPDNLKNFFSFTGTRDEDYFFSVANYIEFLGTPGLKSVLELPDYYEHPTEFSKSLEKIILCLEQMTKALDILFEKVDPAQFYHGFRKKLRSFGVVEFEGTGCHFENLMGASAVQSPLMKVFDAFIGLNHKSDYMKQTEKFMKTEHRLLLESLRKRDLQDLHKAIHNSNNQSIFNEIIQSLSKFRLKHIQVSQEFVSKQSNTHNPTGTGGSPLTQFLSKIQENTKNCLIPNSK